MKLKHRLSIYAILIFSIVILIVSCVIYFSFYSTMERKEMKTLDSKSLLAAIFYLEQDELSSIEHDNIKAQLLKTISLKDIAIYGMQNEIVNGEMPRDANISPNFLAQVRLKNKVFFTSDSYFYNGIFYNDNQGDFVVFTRESKDGFKSQMKSLLHILIIVSILGLAFIYLFSQFLGYIAYEPIIRMIEQIKNRNNKNFNEPIVLKKSFAEVEDLVLTYNQFIDQIAQTFHVQKNFIDYVSHELRSPITALLGTLEVTKQKARTVEEHVNVLKQLNQYTNDLQETLDQMMLLSGAKTNFEFIPIRIDEIVWQIIENQIIFQQAQVNVDIKVPKEDLLTVMGNAKLLDLAINNIIENAIKYSNNQQINIHFLAQHDKLEIHVIDQGIGILATDLGHIKQNFFRGKNTKQYQGKGIGLSMADIILKLHHIDLQIDQNQPKGTRVKLLFN